MKKSFFIFLILSFSATLLGFSQSVEISWIDQHGKVVKKTETNQDTNYLILEGCCDLEVSDFLGLEKLPNLQNLRISGFGWRLMSDKFILRTPQLHKLILWAENGDDEWTNFKFLSNLQVLVFRSASQAPGSLEFKSGLNLTFLGIPGATKLPTLKGHNKIDVLDLSRSSFNVPSQKELEENIPRIGTIYLDDYANSTADWPTGNFRFNGIKNYYQVKYPDAIP